MKKYSANFFEKKFEILFNKLIIKEGFVDEVKEIRKTIGIPVEDGFTDSLELAQFLLAKLTKKEEKDIILWSFVNQYETENHVRVSKDNKEDFFKYFDKNFISNRNNFLMPIAYLAQTIEDHNNLFTSNVLLRKTKFFSKLSPIVFGLFNKYWGFDLLDEWITIHFVEKYSFLGKNGVDQYVKNKIICPSCRYIGIDHFSPSRYDMEGQDKGVFSKNYVFNKSFVRQLSRHFNSVFLVIKPYATKEEVLSYIENNWDWLKEHVVEKNTFYKQLGVNPSKIKESNFDKNQLIYSLYKLSKKDLLKIYTGHKNFHEKGVYKEAIISAILEDKYDIKMSQDAIKKSATRFSKSIKLKNEPRDIGDI